MEELPPELRARRGDIYERVVGAGRKRRHRRFVAGFAVITIMVAIPVAAVALTGSHDAPSSRIVLSDPSSTTSATDSPYAVESSTVPTTEPTTTTSAPTVDTPTFPPVTHRLDTTTTTALACRNSMNPTCGPFHYDPPITNAGAKVVVTIVPAEPTAGEKVTFSLHATDPDTALRQDFIWCNDGGYSFGEPSPMVGCAVACAPTGYGPWDPPAPKPGDLTFTLVHTYAKPGNYEAKFTIGGDFCGPRPSSATTSIKVRVVATSPTT